ncbi:hypothetical protein H6B13_15260 [Bacteroides gallinaceum]|nr:hypothetical protein [Bacteroides gallinaceum]
MSYICQRMKDKSRTDIELTPLKAKIETVFNKRNIDEDCDTIANLLAPYQKAVRELLSQGNFVKAVTVLLEVLESLTYHFVEDEHYNYFDDMYSPDYVCQNMMEKVINAIESGIFPDAELQRLKDGLEKLKHTEAYEDYGVPYALDVWEKFLG